MLAQSAGAPHPRIDPRKSRAQTARPLLPDPGGREIPVAEAGVRVPFAAAAFPGGQPGRESPPRGIVKIARVQDLRARLERQAKRSRVKDA